jgi:nucleotide sugar dehydrogenase
MKIGIVGLGYVGKAMYNLFKDHYEVMYYDPFITLDSSLAIDYGHSVSKEELNKCDLGVVCVPTPMKKDMDNECDLSYVEDAIGWLETPLILLKSTVEIGTTERLKQETGKPIVFSPEYCGESTHYTATKFTTMIKETPFFTFGGDKDHCNALISIFMPVTGPSKVYRSTSATEAEIAKYMENTFFGLKVAFCYEMDQICKAFGVDYNEVRDLWLLDPRISKSHTGVMHTNKKPFGGKCLPKDINALVQGSIKNGYTPEYIQAILDNNDRLGNIRSE